MTDSEDSKPEIEKKEEEEEEDMEDNKTSDVEKEEEGDKSGEEKDEEEKKDFKKKDVKQETSISKKTSTPAKKAPKKAEKKDKSDDDESASEDEDDEEQKVGIYDKPVVLEEGAKRERKKVERLSATFTKTEEKPFEVSKGKGISLGECGFIDFKLNRTLADDLKPLHRLLFKRAGSAFEIKKNLRKFSGFPFGKNDKEYESRKNALTSKSYTTVMIKFMCDILDIPRSGKKEEMIDRLMEFLLKPTDSGRKVPKSKRKGKSDEKKKGSKKAKGNKPEGKKKKKKEGDEEEDEEEEDEDEEEEEEENEEEEEEEEESEVEEPPKKKMKVTKTPKKEKEEKKEKPKKKETKKAAKKAKIESTDEDESDASSDDEPLVKKSDGPPSNEEIREVIKKILDSANLEMVTMKTVVKDVFAKYPKHDLSDRKDFIKNTVRQLIS